MKKVNSILVFFLFLFPIFSNEFSPEMAKKINRYLIRIAQGRKKGVVMKRANFTQEELNAYLNLIYTRRYSPEVKYIKLNLKNDNNVSGNMKVILKGKKYSKIPSFLKDFEIEFEGKIECENYRMRYNFDNLKINGTTFSPEILDQAFSAAHTGFKIKKSIFDWFRLLPGIKKVRITYKKITIFY